MKSVDIPNCHSAGWKPAHLSPTERLFAKGPSTPIYGELLVVLPREPVDQQIKLGNAVLNTLTALAPRFHRSRIGQDVVEAFGTTILVTGWDEKFRNLLVVPWNMGEEHELVMRRFANLRKFLRESPQAGYEYLHQTFMANLPSPQAIVSVVGHLGVQRPFASIGTCGGNTPMEVVTDGTTCGFCWDHAVYSAADAGIFYKEFVCQMTK